jgi:Uma2 family endonuclease
MPTSTHLSVKEYERIYGPEPGWEYWFGEARPKPVPTHLHGLLSLLLGELLRRAGYLTSSEADLQIVPEWRPRPDVYGVLEPVQGKYATKPVDVIFEVLSEGEDIVSKCQQYTRIGIPQVFVFDPEARLIASWTGQDLVSAEDVKLSNGITITGATLWLLFEERQRREDPPASGKI